MPEQYTPQPEATFSRKRTPRVLDFSDNPQKLPTSNDALLRADKVDPLRPTQAQINQTLKQGEGERPVFTHAGTGEAMTLADVRAREAAAAEGITPDSAEREVYPEDVTDSAKDVVVALDAAVDTSDERFYVTEESQDGSVIETGRLDDEHGVRVERDGSGAVIEIFVVAADAGEAHDVAVHPGVEPTEILIDGEPATDDELPAVKAVLSHTAEQIAEKPQEEAPETNEAQEDTEDQEQFEEDDAPEEKSIDDAEKEKKKLHNKQGVAALMPYLSNPAARETILAAAKDAGIDMKAVMAGEVDLGEQAIPAFHKLRAYASPDSAIWRENPQGRGGIGGAAQEAQGVLRQTFLTMMGKNGSPR